MKIEKVKEICKMINIPFDDFLSRFDGDELGESTHEEVIERTKSLSCLIGNYIIWDDQPEGGTHWLKLFIALRATEMKMKGVCCENENLTGNL